MTKEKCMELLKLYKEFKGKKEYSPWELASAFIIYNAIDNFADNPTDEEYKTICDVCYRTYMKSEDVNLAKLADNVCYKYYVDKEFSLGELRDICTEDILNLESFDWY